MQCQLFERKRWSRASRRGEFLQGGVMLLCPKPVVSDVYESMGAPDTVAYKTIACARYDCSQRMV